MQSSVFTMRGAERRGGKMSRMLSLAWGDAARINKKIFCIIYFLPLLLPALLKTWQSWQLPQYCVDDGSPAGWRSATNKPRADTAGAQSSQGYVRKWGANLCLIFVTNTWGGAIKRTSFRFYDTIIMFFTFKKNFFSVSCSYRVSVKYEVYVKIEFNCRFCCRRAGK